MFRAHMTHTINKPDSATQFGTQSGSQSPPECIELTLFTENDDFELPKAQYDEIDALCKRCGVAKRYIEQSYVDLQPENGVIKSLEPH